MSSFRKYRADIDGLRAIAVLLIVLFHANVGMVSGGFIGVDVFFVISGFLISLILFEDLEAKRFSFKNFYMRRIKRLVPALVCMLLLTTVPAYLFLFSDDFEMFGRNQIHSFLTTSNFFLWQNVGGYFSSSTDFFPLLHTWSLAVEEQFYFIWPVTLFFLYKTMTAKNLYKVVVFSLLPLFVLSVYFAEYYPYMAYFLLPARAFELLIGASVALTLQKLPNFSTRANHILSMIGLVLIAVPALTIDKQSVFPGFNALWPCLGAALLLITGRHPDRQGCINWLISHKAFVWVGLISYSLYLWHWPIFVFIQYLGLELVGVLRWGAIAMAFLCGHLSWKYVEQPVRHLNIPTLGAALRRIMLPALIVLVVFYAVIDAENGFPHRFQNLAEFNKRENFPSTVRKRCFDSGLIGNLDDCWLGVKKEVLDGVLIGDSFANHSASFIDVLAKDAGLYIHDSASGGHPLITKLTASGDYEKPPQYAENRLSYALQFEHIIIAANWQDYEDPTNANYERILATVAKIIEQGKKVTIILSVPATTTKNLHKLKLVKGGGFVYFDEYQDKIPQPPQHHLSILNEMKRRFSNITYIDMKDVMCEKKQCAVSLKGTIIYRNSNHLNTSGAALIGERYLHTIGSPFSN